jgi:hypothetical protein
MDQLLAERETVNRELRRVIDKPAEGPWGIRAERVEIKDVSLPISLPESDIGGVVGGVQVPHNAFDLQKLGWS